MEYVVVYLQELFAWIPEPFNEIFISIMAFGISVGLLDFVGKIWNFFGK